MTGLSERLRRIIEDGGEVDIASGRGTYSADERDTFLQAAAMIDDLMSELEYLLEDPESISRQSVARAAIAKARSPRVSEEAAKRIDQLNIASGVAAHIVRNVRLGSDSSHD